MKESASDADSLVQAASDWWSTSIVDVRPGVIRTRGTPIQDLIGRITFPQMIWLMLRGDVPSPEQAALLDAALVAAVDHGPHAPSIAIARMSVSCGLPLNGAMASAVNTLDDIHGGAGEQALLLYERALVLEATSNVDIAAIAAIEEFVSKHGKIVPGFGHRFHPVDPRRAPLLALIDDAVERKIVPGNVTRVAKAIERHLQILTGKPLPMNVDGITAVVYGELGFAAPLARGLFVLSRSVGILAHAWEQLQTGHRIKGPMPPSIPYRYTGA